MQVTADLVRELRERSGVGMMECKKALVECAGDLEAAFEHLRKTGAAKAAKKSGRVAAEGAIVAAVSADGRQVALVEVNSETDFVAKDENFTRFANAVARTVLCAVPGDVLALKALPLDGHSESVEECRLQLIARIGENIDIRRFVRVQSDGGRAVHYLHGTRIGVVVDLHGADESLGRDIAMHIAASRPVCVDETQVPAELLAKEREIYAAQAAESGKPASIIEKVVEGRVKKYLEEVTLVGQPFIKNPDQTVGRLLADAGAKVLAFARLEVGEGIERKQENFAEEVMAQVRGA